MPQQLPEWAEPQVKVKKKGKPEDPGNGKGPPTCEEGQNPPECAPGKVPIGNDAIEGRMIFIALVLGLIFLTKDST